jgi:hypothetical protein
MKIVIRSIILLLVSTVYTHETYPWIHHWDEVTQEDTRVYTDSFKASLEDSGKKIKKLLLDHANARTSKVHVFNSQLKSILDTITTNLIKNAQNFAHEIRSEAQNTYDYKVNKRIHHSTAPSSSAIKNIKTHRKILTNQYNKRLS